MALALPILAQLQQGAAQARTAKAQAGLAKVQASEEEKRADEEAGQMRGRAREMAGYQRAAYSAAGIDLTGTPLLVVSQTLRDSSKDIENMYKQSDARRLEYLTNASIFKDTARSVKIASYLGAGTTLLTAGDEGIRTWTAMQ